MSDKTVPPEAAPEFSARVLNAGFVTALVFTAVLLVVTVAYLFLFMYNVGSSDASTQIALPRQTGDIKTDAFYLGHYETHARLQYQTKSEASNLVFNSCGLLIGVALAFIGVALFMMGIRGEMDASGKGKEVSFRLARLSPGMLAIVCSMVIVLWSVSSRPNSTAPTVQVPAHSYLQPGFGNTSSSLSGGGASSSSLPSSLLSAPLIELARQEQVVNATATAAELKVLRERLIKLEEKLSLKQQ